MFFLVIVSLCYNSALDPGDGAVHGLPGPTCQGLECGSAAERFPSMQCAQYGMRKHITPSSCVRSLTTMLPLNMQQRVRVLVWSVLQRSLGQRRRRHRNTRTRRANICRAAGMAASKVVSAIRRTVGGMILLTCRIASARSQLQTCRRSALCLMATAESKLGPNIERFVN